MSQRIIETALSRARQPAVQSRWGVGSEKEEVSVSYPPALMPKAGFTHSVKLHGPPPPCPAPNPVPHAAKASETLFPGSLSTCRGCSLWAEGVEEKGKQSTRSFHQNSRCRHRAFPHLVLCCIAGPHQHDLCYTQVLQLWAPRTTCARISLVNMRRF